MVDTKTYVVACQSCRWYEGWSKPPLYPQQSQHEVLCINPIVGFNLTNYTTGHIVLRPMTIHEARTNGQCGHKGALFEQGDAP